MRLQIGGLKDLIVRERRFALKEMLRETKVFTAGVMDIYGKIMDLECLEARFFSSGDIVGLVENNSVKVLGTVLDVEIDTLTIYLYESINGDGTMLRLPEGSRLRICEAEPLISYDVQLKLLQSIERGDVKSKAIDLFFNNLSMEELPKPVELKDRLSVDGKFELDEHQCNAIGRALSLDDGELLLIIGPPGTGKTRVVQKAAYLLMERGERVLITSHTNRAVDNAIEKLPVEKSLRVGRPEKILPELQERMLSYKARTSLGEKLRDIEGQIKDLQRRHSMLRKHLKDLKKLQVSLEGIGGGVRFELRKVKRELGELRALKNQLVKGEVERLVAEIPIIGSTLVKSQLYPLDEVDFDTVLIDESSQASVLLALLGMVKAKKWILIGDHKQLLPIFKTIKDSTRQEELSAFVHLLSKYRNRSLWLRQHYRSNAEIIGFSIENVYDREIGPASLCYNTKLRYEKPPRLDVLNPEKPIVFIHCDGESRVEGNSLYNDAERDVCIELVNSLLEAGIKPENIGVITPYRAQKRNLMSKLTINGLEINTVDAFQGREKDVIIFSLTATKGLKFASNPNRLNVAFTRPKYKLIVVGNGKSIVKRRNLLIYKFLEYAYRKNSIYDWNRRLWLT